MKVKLNKNENNLLKSYENDEWVEVPNMNNEIRKHMNYAESTLRKDKRVNIRISQKDLESIQRKAIEEGIPYQTLISSLIHKFVNGNLVEKNKIQIRK